MHDLVDPWKQKMRLEVVATGQLLALRPLEGLKTVVPAACAVGGEGIDRADEAVALVLRDLPGGELPMCPLGHQCAVQPPSTNSSVPVT